MTNVKFDNYLVMSSKEYKAMSSRGTNKYTVTGTVIVPMGSSVPIIVPKVGCVGLAIVQSIKLCNDGTTTFEFKINSASETTAEAAYALYNNEAAVRSQDEDSDERSAPGVYKSRSSGFSSNIFDDDDDDDHPYHPRKW